MNILCISKYASPPNYSKMPARLFLLAKEFIKLGHKTTLITSDSNHFSNYPDSKKIYNFEKVENVLLCWLKTKKYKRTASLSRVLSWLDFERKLFKLDLNKIDKPDIVLVSSLSIFSIIYGYYLKKKFNSFLVFEIRDIWPLTMTEEGGFTKWHPLVLLIGSIEKFGYKKADLVVGTMPRLDLHVKNILGYEQPFHCSPLGFDPLSYKEDFIENNYFDELFPKDKVVIGYAGSMGITNALEPFIETIKLLNDNKNIYFMLVGSGDLKASFEDQLKYCTNVTFLPRIEQNKIKYFLQKCDILYLSTKNSKVWEYGQSMNKVIEYMLSEKPIIASYSGYQTMINESNCGVIINSNKIIDLKVAIEKMSNLSSIERKKLGENGKKWIFKHRCYSELAFSYIKAIEKIKVKNKKTLWIFNHYAQGPDLPGGTRHYDLARELVLKGFEVTIFASGFHYTLLKDVIEYNKDGYKVEKKDGISFVWIKTFPYKKNGYKRMINIMSYAFNLYQIIPKLRLEKPEYIIGSTVHPFASFIASKFAKKYNSNFIYEIRDLWPQTFIDMKLWKENSFITLFFKYFEKKAVKDSNKIIVLSPLTIDYLIKEYSYDKEKVLLLPNGINSSFILPIEQTFDKNINITYLGGIDKVHGLEFLIDLAAKLENESIIFNIYGDGKERIYLERLVNKKELTKIKFRGSVSKVDVPNKLKEANLLFLSTSNVLYGSENKLYEYMAVGKPIIVASSAMHNNPIKEIDCGLSLDRNNIDKAASDLVDFIKLNKKNFINYGYNAQEYVKKNRTIKILSKKLQNFINEKD